MNHLFLCPLAIMLILGANPASGSELAEPGKWKVRSALTAPDHREYQPVILQSDTVRRYRVCSSVDSTRIVKVISDGVSRDLLVETCADVEGKKITITTEDRGDASGTYQNLD